MTDPADLASLKASLRLEARRTRQTADPQGAGEAAAAHFPAALAGPGVVAAYWPLGGEFDPLPLIDRLRASGGEIALPRIADRSGQPRFLLWPPRGDLSPDAFGVPAPPADAPEARPRLILTPLLAFDRAGGRLGQGGGHYDRILARLRPQGVVAMGLAYAVQEIEAVPRGPQDMRLDWVLTEREAIRCGA
ncbi:MAG: 5-formyltetrahydrofolate cyclo-ligase [Alphaproteobacteria bacterium]|nr:5-formyltetrahydrofolate cyclo-ligase [Alphaproteobacteria bacterium]